jgi:hypothetical protein
MHNFGPGNPRAKPICDPRAQNITMYETVTYTCPEGFVFETSELILDGIETSILTFTCADYGDWYPNLTPNCVRKCFYACSYDNLPFHTFRTDNFSSHQLHHRSVAGGQQRQGPYGLGHYNSKQESPPRSHIHVRRWRRQREIEIKRKTNYQTSFPDVLFPVGAFPQLAPRLASPSACRPASGPSLKWKTARLCPARIRRQQVRRADGAGTSTTGTSTSAPTATCSRPKITRIGGQTARSKRSGSR